MPPPESSMFKSLIQHPGYIFKFAIYLLFICFAFVFYFSDMLKNQEKNLNLIYSLLLFLYGAYRLVRTWQDFKKELRDEQDEL
jgi:hypothetical protein